MARKAPGVERQEDAEQGKVHQRAKRAMDCLERVGSLGGRRIGRKAPGDQEGVKQRGGNRVAWRLLCSILAAAKATIVLNVGAGGPKHAEMKLRL